jgi:hypothetical protein
MDGQCPLTRKQATQNKRGDSAKDAIGEWIQLAPWNMPMISLETALRKVMRQWSQRTTYSRVANRHLQI